MAVDAMVGVYNFPGRIEKRIWLFEELGSGQAYGCSGSEWRSWLGAAREEEMLDVADVRSHVTSHSSTRTSRVCTIGYSQSSR